MIRWILRFKFFNVNFVLCYNRPVILKNVLCIVPFEICRRLLRGINITIHIINKFFWEVSIIKLSILKISNFVNWQFFILNLIFIIFSPSIILCNNISFCYFKCRIIRWILVICVNSRRLNRMICRRAENFIIILYIRKLLFTSSLFLRKLFSFNRCFYYLI